MDIDHLTRISEEEWDCLVDSSDDVWLWHTWNWIESIAQLDALETHYFVAKWNGRNAGGLILQIPRHIKRYPVRARSARGWTGPFCNRELPIEIRLDVFRELTEAAVEWARERRNMYALLCTLPPLSENCLRSRGVNPLVVAGWRDIYTHVRIANLSKSESELWQSISYDARRNVKSALSTRYSVERASWHEMLDEYYRIHVETYRRTGTDPDPKGLLNIIAKMEDRGNAVLWVGRDPTGRPVAFHSSARFREGSVYHIGCSENEHLTSGINYLLFWKAILGAKEDGCKLYEIGEIFPNVPVGKQRGLSVYKEKFDGELYRIYRGEISLFKYPIVARIVERMLPRHVRRLVRRTLGRFSR